MGEASRKSKLAEQLKGQLQAIDRTSAQQAVSQVVRAITDFHGADCLLYATIGAGMLTHLGIAARPAAGSAAWRVGPGDADVISHASELGGAKYMPANAEGMAGMFHAWIEVGDMVIDFTTASLADKARMLDEADGGNTQVDWLPQALWADKASLRSLREVLKHPEAGVCSYVRHDAIERVVLASLDAAKIRAAVLAAVHVYRAAVAGETVQVIGLGVEGHQTEPPAGYLERVRG